MSELPDPLVLRVIPAKMRGTAWFSCGLGAFLVGVCVLIMIYGAFFPAFMWIFFVLGVLLFGLGVLTFAIARGRPVALRLDADGLSGYYVPTLNWTEVLRIDRAYPGRETLGIELFDRDAVRRRQRSPMMRFNLRLTLGGNWHLVVPGEVLEADVDAVAATARVFHTAAMARDRLG